MIQTRAAPHAITRCPYQTCPAITTTSTCRNSNSHQPITTIQQPYCIIHSRDGLSVEEKFYSFRYRFCLQRLMINFNRLEPLTPLTGTLKPYSNGPLYSNTVIGTLAADGWAVTFGTARMSLGVLCGPAQSPPHCTKCNNPPINGQVYQPHIIRCSTIISGAH